MSLSWTKLEGQLVQSRNESPTIFPARSLECLPVLGLLSHRLPGLLQQCFTDCNQKRLKREDRILISTQKVENLVAEESESPVEGFMFVGPHPVCPGSNENIH